MSFAAPLALLWGLLALPVIGLYILKVRQRRVPVPTLMFWRQIFDDKRPRTLWQKLRHLLSLLMQLLIVALLVLALADPLLPWQALKARKIVLIVDNSASMNATDMAPSRLEEARRSARRAVDSMRFFDTMAILEAGNDARVACGLNGHRRTLLRAIDSVRPTDGPTKMREAIDLARRLLSDDEAGQIVIVTDAAFPQAADLLQGDRVRLARIGGKAENTGITRFQVRRSLTDPLGYELLIEVMNFGERTAQCRLELYLADELLDVIPLNIEPRGRWSHVLSKTSTGGGQLVAKLDVTDALAADNTAWAVLPKRDPIPVTLVTGGNLFLQRVFEAIPLVDLRVTNAPPQELRPGELLVFHRTIPAKAPAGNVLVIDPAGPSDLWEELGAVDHPLVTDQDKHSPLLAHVRLDNVYMPEARKLKPADGAKVLASALGGEPIYFAFDRPAGRLLVLTVNLDRGDLPLRTAFPIMMTNAMNWFLGAGGESQYSLQTGSIATVPLPVSAERAATLTSPAGDERPVNIGESGATIGPLDRVGIWTLRHGDEAAELPCNLADAAESDLVPAEGLAADAAALAGGFGGKPVWFYLLGALCGLMAVEWFLYQRRWIS